jgi:fructosamine-3-kinase
VTLPAALADAVAAAVGRAVTGGERTSGGSINQAWAVDLDGGERAFVKTRADAGAGEYATEAAGLRWLAAAGGVEVPEVLAVGDDGAPRFLALAWIEEGTLDGAGAEALGRGLATLHASGADAVGASPPGADGPMRIGPLALPNDPTGDWPTFYARRRLEPLLEPAGLSASGRRAVEAVCERITDLAGPPEPPARLHGDLWGGNVMAGRDGHARLIDPAAYGGHREVDLAMLRLFGAPSSRVFAAYEEVAPLAEGHEDRVVLWQLFPLLVHAVLFGGHYVRSAEDAARRCAG